MPGFLQGRFLLASNGYIGVIWMMEKQMETTIIGLNMGFRVLLGLGFLPWAWGREF